MKRCVWCEEGLGRGQVLTSLLTPMQDSVCQSCRQLFYRLEGVSICDGCGRELIESGLCYDCVRWQAQVGERFVRNRALYAYDEMGKAWMERYKFVGDTRVVTMVRRDLVTVLVPLLKEGYALCPLPSSQKSLVKREFETIEYLLTKAELPITRLLQHVGNGKKQSEKTRQERMALTQPFRLREGIDLPSKVVLIDDVYTTGRTIRLAAECLQDAGVTDIQLRTLFRGW